MRMRRAWDIRWEETGRNSAAFPARDGFSTFDWSPSCYVAALLNDAEVARVKLDHDFRPVAYFHRVSPGRFTLVEQLEVHALWRGQGIGLAVLAALQQELPDRTLTAYPTDESRTWWEDKVRPTGWIRIDPQPDSERGWPLYVASRLRDR